MSKLNKKKLERKLNKYIKEKKLENAVKTANRLSKMYPDEEDYISTKAICLELLGRHEEAVKEYRNTLKFPNKDVSDYCITYGQLSEMEMYEDALEVIEEGLKIYPNNEPLVLDKAMSLFILNRKDEAYKYIDSFPKTHDYWDYLQVIKIDAEFELGNPEEAIKICDELLKEEMTIGFLDKKVTLFLELGMLDEIENVVNPLLEDEEFKAWAVSIKTGIYDEKDEVDKALDFANDYLVDDPKNEPVNVAKACVLLNNEKFEESATCIRTSFDGSVSKGIENLVIALLFIKTNNIEPALKVIESIPDDSEVYELSQNLKEGIDGELYDVFQHVKNGIYDRLNEDMDTMKKRIIEHFIGKDDRIPFKKNTNK